MCTRNSLHYVEIPVFVHPMKKYLPLNTIYDQPDSNDFAENSKLHTFTMCVANSMSVLYIGHISRQTKKYIKEEV